jgi:hypothetical protein
MLVLSAYYFILELDYFYPVHSGVSIGRFNRSTCFFLMVYGELFLETILELF